MISYVYVPGQVYTYEDGSTHQKVEVYGLSTDTKPTAKIPNAAPFYEMDTQTVYMFDAENKVWLEQ